MVIITVSFVVLSFNNFQNRSHALRLTILQQIYSITTLLFPKERIRKTGEKSGVVVACPHNYHYHHHNITHSVIVLF